MREWLHRNMWMVILFVLISSTASLSGKEVSNIKFTNVDSSNGLSNNYVHDIISDHLGFIWIATNDGLCRYDGPNKFKVFKGNDPSIENGLRSSNIRTIHEDKNQNLWIGTRLGGLSCLHQPTGKWTTYLHDPKDATSISNNEILSILEDSRGRLWFGTENGLNLFDPEKKSFTSFNIDITNPKALQAKAILSIMEDDKGWIWVGTWAGGLHLLLPSPNGDITASTFRNFTPTNEKGAQHVWKIYQDKQGRYWIGSHSKGLVLMQLPEVASNTPESQSWKPMFHHYYQYNGNTEHPNSISDNSIYDIHEDRNGKLWIATIFGLNYIEPSDLPDTKYNQVTKEKPTLLFHKKYYDLVDEHSLIHNEVNSIYEDQQGIVWFGTYGGISKFNWYNSQFEIFNFQSKNDKSPDIEGGFVCPNQKAWFGTKQKGLYQYDFSKKEFKQVLNNKGNPLIDDFIFSLYSPDNIHLYITTSTNVSVLDINTMELADFPIPDWIKETNKHFYVRKTFVDSQLNVWLGAESGLYHVNTENGIYTHYAHHPDLENTISNHSITDIVEDKNGYLWVSTYNGLNRIKYTDSTNISIKRFMSDINNPKGLPFNRLTCLSSLDDIIYIGTTSGIYSYDHEKDIFNDLNHHNYKRCIQSIEHSKDGHIWASTTEGILHVNIEDKTLNFFKKSDGLGDLSFRHNVSAVDKDGFIYFGSRNGFTRLHPKLAIKNNTPPPIYFTDIKTVSPTIEKRTEAIYKKHLNIDHDAYYLSIEFASLNYNKPEKNQYAYKLEGFDTDWNYTKFLNPVVYTNLEPGDYNFKVKAANNDGIWNKEGKKLSITVKPAIWETWYFKVAMILLTLGIIWLLFGYYANGIKSRNQSLSRYNKDLNHEIRERKKVEQALQEREQYMEYLVQQRTVELEVKNKEVKTLLHKIRLRNEELESIVAKRTEKLQEFNQDLQRSNKDLEQFAYIASHDLQEPLRIISSFLGLLSRKYKTQLDSAAFEYINFALNASERMSDLIKSLLTYSRVGRTDSVIKNVDLNQVLEEKLLDLSHFIKERNAKVIIAPLPIIKCERNQIAMVFYNLINNGIKFNKSKNPRVEVSAQLTEDHNFWQFSIKDNGIGIDSKFNDKIFEVFRRLHTHQDYEGTGIGLAVCQKIIERHEGNIWIDSTPDDGTTFTFTIHAQMEQHEIDNSNQNTQLGHVSH